MKWQFLLLAGCCMALQSLAQIDSTAWNKSPSPHIDTLVVGNFMIIRNGKQETENKPRKTDTGRNTAHENPPGKEKRSKNYSRGASTNWLIFDIGFAGFTDKTDYASAAAQQFAPGANRDWFHLRTIKSVDVNIWLFMQKYNLIKHKVNLKYGLGIELNNYRYTEDIKYLRDPTRIIMDTIHYNKNKLAVDYFTVPLMLNFNFAKNRKEGIGLSLGISAGYRYSARQKLKSPETGKKKTFDDFDLEPWKISYIGELQLGPIRLYGSLATKSMFQRGLDQTPFTLGLRFSNW